MAKRKRHVKKTLSLEEVENKKLPQGSVEDLQKELRDLKQARLDQKTLRKRKKIAKRKQNMEGVIKGGWRDQRDEARDKGATKFAGEATSGKAKKAVKVIASTKPLLRAAAAGDIALMKTILEAEKLNANSCEPNSGLTPLMAAVSKGHVRAVHWLLRRGAKVDARDKKGISAFVIASRGNKLEVLDALLSRNCPLGKDHRRLADLEAAVAASLKHKEIQERLLKEKGVKRRTEFIRDSAAKIEAVKLKTKQ